MTKRPADPAVVLPPKEAVIAAVGSIHDYPMAPRSRAWDAAAAERRWRDLTGSSEEPSSSYRNGFLWWDGENTENFGAYKLLVVDVIDGRTHYVPRAIFATAGGRGVDRADIPEDDKMRVEGLICRLYDRINAAAEEDEDEVECPFRQASVTAGIFQEDDTYKVFLAPLGVLTDGDMRILVGKMGWREGRLPLMFSDSEMGHEDAIFVGNLDNLRMESRDGLEWAVADVDFDTDAEGQEAKRLVDEARFPKVSVHLTDGEGFLICVSDISEGMGREEVEAAAEAFDWDTCDDPVLAVADPVIGAATIVAIPAFAEAEIVTASVDLFTPPKEWFSVNLEGPTPLTVDDEGRVFGHLALWDSCHRGFDGVCVTPPRGQAGYGEFHANAQLMCRDSSGVLERLEVGCLTVDVSHADTRSSLAAAKRHYDDSGTVAAYVRAGEDQWGVWVAGALHPGLEPEKVELLRRLSLSGDWRPKQGTYHLIAAQAVPVPGFPVRARVADGEQVSLITVGPSQPSIVKLASDDALVASAMLSLASKMDALVSGLQPLVEDARRRELADVVDSLSR